MSVEQYQTQPIPGGAMTNNTILEPRFCSISNSNLALPTVRGEQILNNSGPAPGNRIADCENNRLNIVPYQLQNDSFGFVKLKPKSKIPLEQDWPNKPHSFKEAQEWLSKGGNYGVLGGFGNLIIIDADTQELEEVLKNHLPATFTVKTGKGYHHYYLCSELNKKIVLKQADSHHGEIISKGSQVVGPGSIHPESGKVYSIAADLPIKELSGENLFSQLSDFITPEYPRKDPETEVSNLSIVSVLEKAGIHLERKGTELRGSHPVHGSANNSNFCVSPEKNLWYCYRCGTGGGPVSLIGVLEGILDCKDAVKGGLRGDKFRRALEAAEEKYGYYFENKGTCPKSGRPVLQEDQIAELEKKIKSIPSDTLRTFIPERLDPVLKEIAALNAAQADAVLKYIIKDYFGFTQDEIRNYDKIVKDYRKGLKNSAKNRPESQDIIEILSLEEDSPKIHPAQDFSEGLMSYGAIIRETLWIVTSDKKIVLAREAQEQGIFLKHINVDTARFSSAGIRSFLEGKTSDNIPELYFTIRNYIKRYICFPEDSWLSFISLWVLGTYIFKIFRYYPYVWLNAEKGSGKTLLMEVLAGIAFNGELVANPTESVIFRDISNNLVTMFIDEVEQLRKRDKDVYGSLISLLNTGFNKSGLVKRTESTGQGGFTVKSYSSFSPKMFAGISEIDDVLQDRTIRIPLLRKKETEVVERFKETAEIIELQKRIRDDLYIFGLTHGKDIFDIYNSNSEAIEGMEHLSNRELDIWEPIFLLGNIVDGFSEGSTNLVDTLTELSKKSVNEKQLENISQNETFKLLHVVKTMLDEVQAAAIEGYTLTFEAQQVLEYFKSTEEFEWIEKTNALTRRLKKIEIKSDQRHLGGEKKRVYHLDVVKFKDLCDRFMIKGE